TARPPRSPRHILQDHLGDLFLGTGRPRHAHERVYAAVRKEKATVPHRLVELDGDAPLALRDEHRHDASLAGEPGSQLAFDQWLAREDGAADGTALGLLNAPDRA